MAKKMTKAELYKRNYRLVKNAFQDTTLAKKAQTWSDKTLYDTLGIKATKSTPKLKKIDKSKKSYYNRKLNKFLYARSLDIEVKEAKKLTSTRNKKIESTSEYFDVTSKRRVATNKQRRLDLWAKWSAFNNKLMPPALDRQAREINRKKVVGGRKLDEQAHFGYMVVFYMFVSNKDQSEIEDIVKQSPHDQYQLIYKTTVKV